MFIEIFYISYSKVLEVPTITVDPENGIPVVENNNLTLQCSVPGKSAEELASLQFNWTRTGFPANVLSSERQYRFTNIMKAEAGSYSCRVLDNKTLLSQETTIDVVVHCKILLILLIYYLSMLTQYNLFNFSLSSLRNTYKGVYYGIDSN